MQVQCKGSGRMIQVGGYAKRAPCAVCSLTQDVTSNGRLRKHMRNVTKQQLRRMG